MSMGKVTIVTKSTYFAFAPIFAKFRFELFAMIVMGVFLKNAAAGGTRGRIGRPTFGGAAATRSGISSSSRRNDAVAIVGRKCE